MGNVHTVKGSWVNNLAFDAQIDDHTVRMDAPIEGGGDNSGPSPKKLMLAALCGCTGMDVVGILKKMRVEVESCNVLVEGELTDDHPKYYKQMHVIYEFAGKDLPMEKLEKAVQMSEETYCGVGALYKKVIPVTSEIRIIG